MNTKTLLVYESILPALLCASLAVSGCIADAEEAPDANDYTDSANEMSAGAVVTNPNLWPMIGRLHIESGPPLNVNGEQVSFMGCGGIIVGDNAILTAGHCNQLNPNKFKLPSGTKLDVQGLYPITSYSTPGTNDIALAKLTSKAPTSIKRACIAKKPVAAGAALVLVGFSTMGATDPDYETCIQTNFCPVGPPQRRYATIKATRRDPAKGTFFSPNNMKILSGDSGSPAFSFNILDPNGQVAVYGVPVQMEGAVEASGTIKYTSAPDKLPALRKVAQHHGLSLNECL